MRWIVIAIIMCCFCGNAAAQSNNPDFYQRVEERLAATCAYFQEVTHADAAVQDTFEYTQRIFLIHLEKIKTRTSQYRRQVPMFDYAVKLHDLRLGKCLPPELSEQYRRSFDTTVSGFQFCRECRIKRRDQEDRCRRCGAAFATD